MKVYLVNSKDLKEEQKKEKKVFGIKEIMENKKIRKKRVK